MLEIMKFRAWLQTLCLNLIMDESELWAQSLKVEARAFRAFEQLVQRVNDRSFAKDHLGLEFIPDFAWYVDTTVEVY